MKNIKAWLASGRDEAVLSFIYGGLRFVAAAVIGYTIDYLGKLNLSTPEAVIAVGVIDRALKSLWIYTTSGTEVVPKVEPTTSTMVAEVPMDGGGVSPLSRYNQIS